MRHIRISARADDDLEAIGDYTEANWGVQKEWGIPGFHYAVRRNAG